MAELIGAGSWGWLCVAVLGAGLGLLAWIDLRTGYLPDIFQAALAVLGAAVVVAGSPVGIGWQAAVGGALLNAAVFLSLRWLVSRLKGREAMGLGDVKLVAVGGLWLGPWALPMIMAVGGLSTLVGVGIVSLIRRKALWRGEMPLGPGLAAGIFGCFVAAVLHLPGLKLSGP